MIDLIIFNSVLFLLCCCNPELRYAYGIAVDHSVSANEPFETSVQKHRCSKVTSYIMSSPGSPSTPKRPGSGGSSSAGARNSSHGSGARSTGGCSRVARSSPRISAAKETPPLSPVSSMHQMTEVYRTFCEEGLVTSLDHKQSPDGGLNKGQQNASELSSEASHAEADKVVDRFQLVFGSSIPELDPNYEARQIFEWALKLPLDDLVTSSRIKSDFPTMHPNRIQRALDFLAANDFICSTSAGNSRNQSYFLLYRPCIAVPELAEVESENDAEESGGVDAAPRKRRAPRSGSTSSSSSSSSGARSSAATSEEDTSRRPPISPGANIDAKRPRVYPTVPMSPERPPSPPIIREEVSAGPMLGHLHLHHVAADATTCSVDNATRDRIVQHVSKAFPVDDDSITVADLKRYIRKNDLELCSGSESIALEEPHLGSILLYLADLNRIMVDGSGDDRIIYKI